MRIWNHVAAKTTESIQQSMSVEQVLSPVSKRSLHFRFHSSPLTQKLSSQNSFMFKTWSKLRDSENCFGNCRWNIVRVFEYYLENHFSYRHKKLPGELQIILQAELMQICPWSAGKDTWSLQMLGEYLAVTSCSNGRVLEVLGLSVSRDSDGNRRSRVLADGYALVELSWINLSIIRVSAVIWDAGVPDLF